MTAITDPLQSQVRSGFLLSNRALAEFMLILSRDAASDVEVVSREMGLSAVMLERLRHALDCLELSAKVLAAAGDRSSTHVIAEAVERDMVERQMVEREVFEAMEAHVQAWPQDVVNWLHSGRPMPRRAEVRNPAFTARTLGGISRRAITPRALNTRRALVARSPGKMYDHFAQACGA